MVVLVIQLPLLIATEYCPAVNPVAEFVELIAGAVHVYV